MAGLKCDCNFFEISNETVICPYKDPNKMPTVKECIADSSIEFIYPNEKTKKFQDRIETPSGKSSNGSGAVTVE